eukprot:gene3576-24410_t
MAKAEGAIAHNIKFNGHDHYEKLEQLDDSSPKAEVPKKFKGSPKLRKWWAKLAKKASKESPPKA